MEEKRARLDTELKAKAAAFEQEMQRRQAEFDRECASSPPTSSSGSWQTYAKPYQDLRAANDRAQGPSGGRAEPSASAEIAALRARLAELEPEVSVSLVA